MTAFIMLSSSFVALIFIVAAAGKFADNGAFVLTLRQLHLGNTARLLSLLTPMVELGLGLSILLFYNSIVAGMALALCAMFVLVQCYIMVLPEPIQCNCLGALTPSHGTPVGLLRSLALLFLAGLTFIHRRLLQAEALTVTAGNALFAIALVGITLGLSTAASRLHTLELRRNANQSPSTPLIES